MPDASRTSKEKRIATCLRVIAVLDLSSRWVFLLSTSSVGDPLELPVVALATSGATLGLV